MPASRAARITATPSSRLMRSNVRQEPSASGLTVRPLLPSGRGVRVTPESCRPDAFGEQRDAVALQVRECGAPTRRRDDDRFTRPAHFGAFTARPVDVGGDERQALHVALGVEQRRALATNELERTA